MLFLNLGQLSNCCWLATQESHAFAARISPGNIFNAEEAAATHKSLRSNLLQAVSSSEQKTLATLLEMERELAFPKIAHYPRSSSASCSKVS